MNIVKLDTTNCVQETIKLVMSKTECYVYGIADKPCVFPGEAIVDENVCKENGIQVLRLPSRGGAIVVNGGDIEFAQLKNGVSFWGKETLGLIQRYLNLKGINAEIQDNDLMVDGVYKVASHASALIDGFCYTTVHVSINANIPLIKLVCTKPMKKIPKGLSEFGITAEEMLGVLGITSEE